MTILIGTVLAGIAGLIAAAAAGARADEPVAIPVKVRDDR